MKNLREICRHRILEEMVRKVHKNNYVAMIVDEGSLKVMSACCKVYDILEEGVTVVKKITKKRQPLPQLDGLYFLSPTEESVRALISDFKKTKQYKTIHV
eukprot:Platyproteum_vivax@DN12760_c0_g1_i1.p1